MSTSPSANIELSSQSPSSSSQLHTASSSSSSLYPRPSNGQFAYLPQQDEDHHQSPQSPQIPPIHPQRPQNLSLENRLKACVEAIFILDIIKAAKIAFYLIMLFYIIDLFPLYYFTAELLSDASRTPRILGAIEFISANLKADPIMDLQIIDRKATCPPGFEPLKLSTWPGTVAGCLCENGDLLDSPCEKSQSGKCRTIPETHSVDIYEIDDSFWCAKRAVLDKDYVKKIECPSGYKECYIGGCFVGDCPVTQVEITSQKGLTLTRNQGELPMVDIKVTPNDIPCFNQDFSPSSPDKNLLYKLLRTKENGCDKHGLDRTFSKRLNTKPTFDSYTQSSYRYSVMNLPDYKKYAKNTMSVTTWRTRIITAKNEFCLGFDEKNLGDSIKMFYRSFPAGEIILQIDTVHVAIILMTVLYRYFCNCCISGSDEFFQALSRSRKSAFRLLSISYIPALIQLLKRINDYRSLKVLIKYFEEFSLLGCFGEGQGSQVVNDYLEVLRKGEYQYLLYFGLVISYGLPILIYCWFLLVKKTSSPQSFDLSDLPRDLPDFHAP